MHRPTERQRRVLKAVAIPGALLASALMVWQGSYAAFSATTSNAGNNWATGKVALVDDDAGAAAFAASGLKPGSTGSKCIQVTSNGTLPGSVKLYSANVASTNSLASYVQLKVEQGSGATFAGGCGAFVPTGYVLGSAATSVTLATFGSTNTNFTNGVGSWALAGTAGESRSFRITWTIDAAAPSTVQGSTASGDFVWEAQNS